MTNSVSGVLVDRTGSYHCVFYLAGSLIVVAGIVQYLVLVVSRRDSDRNRKAAGKDAPEIKPLTAWWIMIFRLCTYICYMKMIFFIRFVYESTPGIRMLYIMQIPCFVFCPWVVCNHMFVNVICVIRVSHFLSTRTRGVTFWCFKTIAEIPPGFVLMHVYCGASGQRSCRVKGQVFPIDGLLSCTTKCWSILVGVELKRLFLSQNRISYLLYTM